MYIYACVLPSELPDGNLRNELDIMQSGPRCVHGLRNSRESLHSVVPERGGTNRGSARRAKRGSLFFHGQRMDRGETS